MSLLRLLTAGKSLVGLKKSDIRYHVTRQRWLPKFGSKKNPFRTSSDSGHQPLSMAVPEVVQAQVLASKSGGESAVQAEAGQARDRYVCVPVKLSNLKKQELLVEPKRKRSGLTKSAGMYVSKLAAGLIRSRPRETKPMIASFAPLVQGELSLDRVKVVRNDLSDSDLEVVRSKPQTPATEVSSLNDSPEKFMESGSGWTQVTGRLLGVGKT